MTIIGHSAALAVAAMALGLAVSGCTGSSESGGPAATTATVHAPEVAAATDTDLAALVPSPANATTSTGPDRIADGGIHRQSAICTLADDLNASKGKTV